MPRRSALLSLVPGPARRRRELAETAVARRRHMVGRCSLVSATAALLHLAHGWPWAWLWAGLFVGAVLVESEFSRRQLAQPAVSRRAFVTTLALYALVGAVYASIALPLWLSQVSEGRVSAVLLLTGTLVSIGVLSGTSRAAFVASSAPNILVFVACPVYTVAMGGAGAVEALIFMGMALLVVQTAFSWRDFRRSRKAEADARAESDRRRMEAEAATAAKSAFVAVVGHELRTPISGVLAAAAELQRRSQDPEQAECAALVADSARFMQTLLSDLLDMAKLEAGRMTVEETPFDLGLLLHETSRFWSVEAVKRGVPLRMESAFGLPGRVSGDPTRVRQILNNLLSNALKFTGPDGVAWSADAAPVRNGQVLLTIRVRDTGDGVPPEKLDRLFTPFEQADVSVARTHGGTGLGLAISRELARLMGGDLRAENGAERGAVFEFVLPLVTVPQTSRPAEPTPAAEAPVMPPLRVLVVDDHDINRRTMALLLEPLQIETVFAAGGEEALAFAATEIFDLILMDVMMPELDGRETTRRLRRGSGPNRRTPVVAVTGGDSPEELQACLQAGMNACVAKPIAAEALYQAIHGCLPQSDEPAFALSA